MTKIFKHARFEHNLTKLIEIKGQGIVIRTDSEKCYCDSSTVVSADITKPLVMKQGNMFLIIVDSTSPRSVRNFEVIIISKHILKKARVEAVAAPVYATQHGSFKQTTPWILTSQSARNGIHQ